MEQHGAVHLLLRDFLDRGDLQYLDNCGGAPTAAPCCLGLQHHLQRSCQLERLLRSCCTWEHRRYTGLGTGHQLYEPLRHLANGGGH